MRLCSLVILCLIPLFAEPKLTFHGEYRTWFEARTGVAFGAEPHIANPLPRARLAANAELTSWLSLSGMVQDTRAPFYGRPAPGSARDPLDLHEAYVDIRAAQKTGFGARLGRTRAILGNQHVIGTPEWSNSGRTYDAARVFYRWPSVRVEALLVSSVRFRPGEFNKPALGDRVWGMYNSFSKLLPGQTVDVYVLRHDQNRPGGWTGPGRLLTITGGARLSGALAHNWSYELESASQGGSYGNNRQRGHMLVSALRRQLSLVLPMQLSVEYKQASPDFDQLYPANHDRFGHADLLGFRNIRNLRLINRVELRKRTYLTLGFTENHAWNSSLPVYNPAGRPIQFLRPARSGIGREFAAIATHRVGHFDFAVAFAHWFASGLPGGVNPRYLYYHQGFTF